MARICCLAGIDEAHVPMFTAVFRDAGDPAVTTLASLHVSELGRLLPDVLVCDLDGDADDSDKGSLELLRQIRFVLPECLIAVYTAATKRAWGRACHLAGANCLLSKASNELQLSAGLRAAANSGCYTDPHLVS